MRFTASYIPCLEADIPASGLHIKYRQGDYMANPNRDEFISQVKEEYSGIAVQDSQQHFHETTTGITPEAYYNTLCDTVIMEINNGTFDNCKTGLEIVNKVAADKSLLPTWGN